MKPHLSDMNFLFKLVLAVSALALSVVFLAQFGFSLAPCALCLYQRMPFMAAIVFCLAGLLLKARPDMQRALIALNGLAFAIGALIAVYHSGVERRLWKSMLEGCAVDFETKTGASLLQTIMDAKPARCDEIPWADPFFGLSMANYNAGLCAALAMMLIYCLIKQFQTRSARP